MTPADILQKICDDNNITIKQLSELTGYNLQTLYGITRGRAAKMPQKLSDKIVSLFPQYNPMWLMTGNEAFLNQRGTTINIDNSNTGYHNNIGNGTQTNNSGDTEMWKKIIAEKDAQIAELKADKERLYQLLLKQ